jgi:hypothetical protein
VGLWQVIEKTGRKSVVDLDNIASSRIAVQQVPRSGPAERWRAGELRKILREIP